MGTKLEAGLEQISGQNLATIMSGLAILRSELRDCSKDDLLLVADTLGSLFFIDAFDRPDLSPAVESAIELLAEAGPDVIPFVMETFHNSDVKASICFARVLGKIGLPAIPHLTDALRNSTDPYAKSYALYALGKIKERAILAVLTDVIEATESEHPEVRDSAIRTLGKIMEQIGSGDLSADTRDDIFRRLVHGIGDAHSAIRAKSIRSLGKMARSGLLTAAQKDQLVSACRRVAGRDDAHSWDRAFIVRKEALAILQSSADLCGPRATPDATILSEAL